MAHARLMSSSRRLTADGLLVMDGRGCSEGVHGIERGIKLPVMRLANGTGEEVICHHATTTFSSPAPASGVDGVEPGKDITR